MEGKVSDWIERAVVESDRRRCAAKVASISAESAVEQGENFASDLKRLTLEVVLNSGERQTRKLIYKTFPEGENRVLLTKKNGIFVREIRVYQDVLSEMEIIWREKEPATEYLWPELYSAQRRYEGLLMEDLSAKGFEMVNRRKGLDYEHSLLVMQSLAKFHAVGAVLRNKGDLRIKDFYPAVFMEPTNKVPGLFKNIFLASASKMETELGGEWTELGQRLRKLAETVEDIVEQEFNKESNSKFLILNHGDCWINNILFRYDRNGKPEALRFVDFQMAHYNSPAFDLQYFLHTSPDLETRDRKEELVQDYHKSLTENLRLFDYPENEIPSLEDIMEQYNGARYLGFCTGIAAIAFMLRPTEKTQTNEELDDLMKQLNEKKNANLGSFDSTDDYSVKVFKYVINEGVKNKIL